MGKAQQGVTVSLSDLVGQAAERGLDLLNGDLSSRQQRLHKPGTSLLWFDTGCDALESLHEQTGEFWSSWPT